MTDADANVDGRIMGHPCVFYCRRRRRRCSGAEAIILLSPTSLWGASLWGGVCAQTSLVF